MSGIIFIIPVALWFFVLLKVHPVWEKRLPKNLWGLFADIFVCILFMLLPLADEIIAGFQFRALCNAEIPLKIDPSRVEGKVVRYSYEKLTDGPRIATPLSTTLYMYSDSTTGETLFTYKTYTFEAGFLVRMLFDTNLPPLTIIKNSCSPEKSNDPFPQKYKFTLIK